MRSLKKEELVTKKDQIVSEIIIRIKTRDCMREKDVPANSKEIADYIVNHSECINILISKFEKEITEHLSEKLIIAGIAKNTKPHLLSKWMLKVLSQWRNVPLFE